MAVLPALIQRQTDVPASLSKSLGGVGQFNRRRAEQYTAAATNLFGDSDQFSGFLWLASTAFAANAANNASITDCVDLAGNHEIVRSGGAQSMLLRDGQSHYLIGFRGDCASLATASSIQVSSDGTANRLCPTGTKVKTNRATCSVGKVEAIDADQFSALKKRASR